MLRKARTAINYFRGALVMENAGEESQSLQGQQPKFIASVSSLFTSMYFRSSTRRRFPLQSALIVINGGMDEIF
jgi:hypothetical protein